MSFRVHSAWRYLPPVLMLAFSIGFLIWSSTYDEQSRQVPMLIAWSMLILCALDLVATTGTKVGSVVKAFFTGTIVGEATGEGTARPLAKTFVAMAWPIAFVGAVVFFGFVLTIPVYVFLFVVLQGRKSVRLAIISAISTAAFTYVVFDRLLQYEVYKGLLFGG